MKEDHDFHQIAVRLRNMEKTFQALSIPAENKELVNEFITDCQAGLYGKKISKHRVLRTLKSMRVLCELLPEARLWPDVTRSDIKKILLQIDEIKGDWERYLNLINLRKFLTWLRREHGYPEGYPDRERLMAALPLLEYAPEARFNIPRPNKLKPLNEIPTKQEIDYIKAACDTYEYRVKGIRDKCLISLLEEIGARIGGLGNLCIRDVAVDEIGALLNITDKTMNNAPVRVITSTPNLITWLNVHPLKDDPGAPLWVNLGERRNHLEPMTYAGLKKALQTAVQTHNSYADEKGLAKITRRIHFHAFRYYAQTRDMREGMPVSIQCAQRGWSPLSKQPQRYARISTAQVDEWLTQKYAGDE